jgi:hypothetical protein
LASSRRASHRRRLRWALLAFCLHIPVGLFLLVSGVGEATGEQAERDAPLIGIFIATGVPGTVSILIFLEDVGRNVALSDEWRKRWRLLIASVPYAVFVYWWRYGRRERNTVSIKGITAPGALRGGRNTSPRLPRSAHGGERGCEALLREPHPTKAHGAKSDPRHDANGRLAGSARRHGPWRSYCRAKTTHSLRR